MNGFYKPVLTILFISLLFIPSYINADPPTLNIPPTNAFDKIHTDNGTIDALNFSMPFVIKGSSNISVKSSNNTHTITISNSGSATGTYNTTQANNIAINTGGYKINFINGSGATVHVENSKLGTQVNVTVSATGTGGISSVQGTDANITSSCVGGVCTVNTGSNVVVTNGIRQNFTKNLDLGGPTNNQDIFDDMGIVIRNPLHTHAYLLNASSILGNETLQLPLHGGTLCVTNQTTTCGNNTATSVSASNSGILITGRDVNFYSGESPSTQQAVVTSGHSVANANFSTAYPFWVGQSYTTDQLAVNVPTNTNTPRCSFAFYNDSNNYPSILQFNTSTNYVTAQISGTGVKTFNISPTYTFSSNRLYWVDVICTSTNVKFYTYDDTAGSSLSLNPAGITSTFFGSTSIQYAKTFAQSGMTWDHKFTSGQSISVGNGFEVAVITRIK